MDLPTSTMNPSNVSKTKIWSHHFPCSNSSLDFCHSWDKHRDPCCGSRASAASSVVVFWRLLSLAHWVTAPFTFLQLAPKSYLLHPKEPLLRMFLPFAWHILSPAGPPLTYSTPQTSHIGEAPLSWIFRLTHIPRSKHVCVCVLSHFSRVWLCNPMDCSTPGCPWNSPGRNAGVGCHALLQGIFPTQGSNLRLLSSTLAVGFSIHSATWEAHWGCWEEYNKLLPSYPL